MIVVDASVAVKWFVPEILSVAAERLLIERPGELIAPDFFAIEVCAALVREANRDKTNRHGAEAALVTFDEMLQDEEVRLHQTTLPHLFKGAGIAISIGHPLKDCIYLALAMERECPLVTADVKFAEKATQVWAAVKILGE